MHILWSARRLCPSNHGYIYVFVKVYWGGGGVLLLFILMVKRNAFEVLRPV